ncbi:helix-turn-helix domain-containing protein [Dongia sp.]|uniref:helix-turn-helix domain-containing protein n=1 Tax=Dongia sp. TaxID=1977262 RepID=UPI003750327A
MDAEFSVPKSLAPFGRAIRQQRTQLGLSQEKLANRCGFDRTYISMLERGKRNPSLLNLLKLAEGLETSVSRLTEVYDDADAD